MQGIRLAQAALFVGIMAACGTQVGNPTGSGFIRITENPAALNTLMNAAFLQTVDGMNMGDYAYSRSESRVSTARSCQTAAGSAFSLIDTTESAHSVTDDSSNWLVKADLSITRSYRDSWKQNNLLLTCDPKSQSLSMKYERLQQGTIRLQSVVDENLTRTLTLTEVASKKELKHSLITRKTGTRTLDFINYTEDGKEVILEAELNNKLESTVQVPTDDIHDGDATTEALIQLKTSFPMALQISLNQTLQWTRYSIPNGRQDFLIPSSGETLRLEFIHVVFDRSKLCLPVAGEFKVTVSRPNQDDITYSTNFASSKPLTLARAGSTDTLTLIPFACVLKER